ncbi:hypothetical protein GQ42DRAFT_163421 [Ramicandelaber brevisporus]|nr:hypothetical protein GQ42DRAFT_163421 [Ramicandelaber brevisporus]
MNSCPFTADELVQLREFDAYNWSGDADFQQGLVALRTAMPHLDDLAARAFYFSRKTNLSADKLQLWLSLKQPQPSQSHQQLERKEQLSPESVAAVFKRFEEYPFATDQKFLAGLPKVFETVTKSKHSSSSSFSSSSSSVAVDYDKTVLKARAIYYNNVVEPLDFKQYIIYSENKKREQAAEAATATNEDGESKDDLAAACPFAHLWHSKSAMAADTVTKMVKDAVDSGALVTLDMDEMLATSEGRVLTKRAMHSIERALRQTGESAPTIVMSQGKFGSGSKGSELAAEAASAKQAALAPDAKQIEYVDSKIFCGSLANDASNTHHRLSVALASRRYMASVAKTARPVVAFISGNVHCDCAYIGFMPSCVVVSEHASASFSLSTSSKRLSALALLAGLPLHKQPSSSSLPPAGTALYLLLSPTLTLRAPELLQLGLAHFFVPHRNMADIESAILHIVATPPSDALMSILRAIHASSHSGQYPGPSRINSWRTEIEDVFADVTTASQIVDGLRNIQAQESVAQYRKDWAAQILDNIEKLGLEFVDVVIESLRRASTSASLAAVIDLEGHINRALADADGGNLTKEAVFAKVDELVAANGDVEDIAPSDLESDAEDESIEQHAVAEEGLIRCPVTGLTAPAGAPIPFHH